MYRPVRYTLCLAAVLLLVVAQTRASFDVVKTRQGFLPPQEAGPSAPIFRTEDFERIVVRDGRVASAFSLETSMMESLLPSFMRSRTFPIPFSLFRLYEEDAQQSRFIVSSREAPVVITNYGVMDESGALTTRDLALGVSAAYRQYATEDKEGQKEFLYHLELTHECKEYDVERFVVVQLRLSPDLPTDSSIAEGQNEATFVFRKVCPSPPAPVTLVISSVDEEAATGRNQGAELDIAQPSVLDQVTAENEPRKIYLPPERVNKPDGHRPAYEDNLDELVQWLKSMPAWLQEALKTSLLTALALAVIVLVVDILRGLWNSSDADTSDEESADDEIEPLLDEEAHQDEVLYQQLPQEEPVKQPSTALADEAQESKTDAASQ